MECCDATINLRIERGTVSVLGRLRNELAAAEAQLRCAASWGKNGRVLNDDADWLLFNVGPYRRRLKAAAEKLEVLQKE